MQGGSKILSESRTSGQKQKLASRKANYLELEAGLIIALLLGYGDPIISTIDPFL